MSPDKKKYDESHDKLMKYGFVKYAVMVNEEKNLAGAVYIHPQTKVRVDLYPDGNNDRSGNLKEGWKIPMLEKAKEALQAEMARSQQRVDDTLARFCNEEFDDPSDVNLLGAIVGMTNTLKREERFMNRANKILKSIK